MGPFEALRRLAGSVARRVRPPAAQRIGSAPFTPRVTSSVTMLAAAHSRPTDDAIGMRVAFMVDVNEVDDPETEVL